MGELLSLRPAKDPVVTAPRPMDRRTLQALHALIFQDQAAAILSPLRVLFVVEPHSRARLAANLPPDAQDDLDVAAATALLAYDFEAAREQLLGLVSSAEEATDLAGRCAKTQAQMLHVAAHALGLVTQPVSRFDAEGLKRAFFANDRRTVTAVVNLAFGLR